MKTLFTLLFFCFSYSVFASHLMGGYISAKQLSGRQYQITTVVLSDPAAPANELMVSISLMYGDGQTETVTRTSVTSENGIQLNAYISTHQYSTDGIYTITYTDPNLPDNIVNINGGFSDAIPFKTTCMIKVSNTVSGMKSARPLAFELVNGFINKTIHYNPTFAGGDSDAVLIELVSENTSFTNYTLPQGSSVNTYSGMLTFTPKVAGLYLFVIRASSYQDGILISRSEAIQMMRVRDGIGTIPTVDMPDALAHPQGWLSRILTPDQSVEQSVTFTENGNSPFAVDVYSELFDKGATTTTTPAPHSASVKVNWVALPAYQRTIPYFITYRFRTSSDNLIDDYNIAFYHGAPVNTGIHDISAQGAIQVYPNPVYGSQCTFVFQSVQQGVLSVYDIVGRSIISEKVNSQEQIIETGDWKPGIYTYSFTTQNGETLQGKLQIR